MAEVLDVGRGWLRARVWFYRWGRPVLVELRGVGKRFRGGIYAGGEVSWGDLAEIHSLLREVGVSSTLGRRGLELYGGFRDALLGRLGRWRATYAGGLAFRVGGRAVEFGEDLSARVRGAGPLFCAGLRLLGVAARLVDVGRGRGDVVLGVDGFFGLAAASGAAPEGFERLWSGEGLLVFRRGATYYFVVEVGGVWRAAWGAWDGERRQLELRGGEEEVLRGV